MVAGRAYDWKPADKTCAVCFTIDDVHPTLGEDGRAIGEVARQALENLEWLGLRHPYLRATLFVTPDWRSTSPLPRRAALPLLGDLVDRLRYRSPVLPAGTLRLDRHPSFVAYLRSLPRVEFGLHGLHHVRRGQHPTVEFRGRSRTACRRLIERSRTLMHLAGLPTVSGLTPPGWEASRPLLEAMADLDMRFIASARDLETPVTYGAQATGSGLRGLSLLFPQQLSFGTLRHFTTNYQATSTFARAEAVLEAGGLLAIKAHLLNRVGSYVALDGLDKSYASHLDSLFGRIADRYGSNLWWTTMGEMSVWSAIHPTETTVR